MTSEAHTHTVEPVGDVRAGFGEGPCWDAATGTLLWVDIGHGQVHRSEPRSGATTTIDLEPPVSAAIPTTGAGLLVAQRHRLVLLAADGERETVGQAPPEPSIRFNDAQCDPRGRLWIGTMHTDKEPGTATLYRLDAGGLLRTMVPGVTVSNGLGWSPDGRRLYYVDTPTRRVDVFDYDPHAATIRGRRPFVDLGGLAGRPDGLTVDAEGGVWVALIGGAVLHRYTAQGQLDTVVPLPVSHPTSCAFGGLKADELYVSTAAEPLSATERAAQPLAGRLLRMRPGVAGLPSMPVDLAQ